MTNTQILCFVLGWQGGTVHLVAKELQCSVSMILDASDDDMQVLCRKAQKAAYNNHMETHVCRPR